MDQPLNPVFETPAAAELAFYRAFAQADLAGMMAVWAPEDDITCVHPMSTPLDGRAAVHESWAGIFRNGPGLSLRVETRHVVQTADLAVHVVYEHIRANEQSQFQPPVVATNVYRQSARGWHMILHHASPTPPARAPSKPTVLH